MQIKTTMKSLPTPNQMTIYILLLRGAHVSQIECFDPSTMWAPGMELKPLDLVESTFTHPNILPTQNHYYFLKYKKKMLTCPYN